jgi:hypothetical protein
VQTLNLIKKATISACVHVGLDASYGLSANRLEICATIIIFTG